MSTTKPRTAAQAKALAALAKTGSMGRRTLGATAAELDASPAALAALVRQGLARSLNSREGELSGAPSRYRITAKGIMAAETGAQATTGGIMVTDTTGWTATARRIDDLPDQGPKSIATYIVRDHNGETLGAISSGLDHNGETVWRTSRAGETYAALWQAVRAMAGMLVVASVHPVDPEPSVQPDAPRTTTRQVEIMAERVRRSTGVTAKIENAGGGTMVAVVRVGNHGPGVLAFHSEGYAVYEDMEAWRQGDDPVYSDTTSPLETVIAVVPWLVPTNR